eukprot:487433_1
MALLIAILTLAIRSCLHGRLTETCSTNHQTVIIITNKSLHPLVLTSQVIMGICELSRSFWITWDIRTMGRNGLQAIMNEYNIMGLINVSNDDYDDDDDDNDDEEDDYNGNKKRISSNLNSIQLSVSISKEEDQEVERLDDIPSVETEQSDFGRNAYEKEIYEQEIYEQEIYEQEIYEQEIYEQNQKQNLNNNLLQPNRGKLHAHIHRCSMYDSCMSSDEYQYDSDEYDEYLTMSDEEIINKLCPFKFLNIYAHDWEGYRLLDLHMNDVWNFIEECRMKNMNLKKEWKIQSENMDHDMDMNMDNMNGGASNHLDKPPKISCLIFCTKNNIPMTRLNSEIGVEQNMILSQIGQSICTIIETYKSQQIIQENNIWNKQIENYQKYLDLINSKTEEEFPKKNILLNNKEKLRIKLDLVSEIKKKK